MALEPWPQAAPSRRRNKQTFQGLRRLPAPLGPKPARHGGTGRSHQDPRFSCAQQPRSTAAKRIGASRHGRNPPPCIEAASGSKLFNVGSHPVPVRRSMRIRPLLAPSLPFPPAGSGGSRRSDAVSPGHRAHQCQAFHSIQAAVSLALPGAAGRHSPSLRRTLAPFGAEIPRSLVWKAIGTSFRPGRRISARTDPPRSGTLAPDSPTPERCLP